MAAASLARGIVQPRPLQDELYSVGGYAASSMQRPPSAGRRPPSARALPDFPSKRDDRGPIASGLSGYGAPSGYTYDYGRSAAPAATIPMSSGPSSTSAAVGARSPSVPRPASRTGASGASSAAAAAAASAAAAAAAAATAQSSRPAVRSILSPGSILDSLKTPSVLPSNNGAIASLARRTNSSSGLDYTSLASGSYTGTGSSLRLKRQVGLSVDTSGGAAPPPPYASSLQQQQQHAHYTHIHAQQQDPRSVYVSTAAPLAAGGGGGASSYGVAGTPAAAGTAAAAARRLSVDRSGQSATGPSAPPLPQAGGVVYAAQYAHQQYGGANTVLIPYSSSAQSAGAYGSGAQSGGAPGGSGSYGAAYAGAPGYPAQPRAQGALPPSLAPSASGAGGGYGAPLPMSPASAASYNSSFTTGHAAATVAQQQQQQQQGSHSTGQLLSADYGGTRSLQRNGSSSSTRTGGAGGAASPSAASASARLRMLSSTAADDAASVDGSVGGGSTNSSMRRGHAVAADEAQRWQGAAAAGRSSPSVSTVSTPTGAAGRTGLPSPGAGGGGSEYLDRDAHRHHPAPASAPAPAPQPSQQQQHAQQQQYPQQQQAHAGSTLEAGGSSYMSHASTGSSSKSSVAAVGTASSTASSRTTSTTSQRSVDDEAHRPMQQQQQQQQPRQQQQQQQAAARHAGSAQEAPPSPAAPSVCPWPIPDLPVVAPTRDTPAGRGCVGLQNLGNTCFMNSILQSLNAVPELVCHFATPSDRKWSSKAVVAPAYSGLARDMISGSLGSVVNPSAFLRKLAKHDGRWGDGRQQDSQEFLSSLLEVLQSECNRITCKPTYRELKGKGSEEEQAAEAYAYARTWNDSIIDDVFGGMLQSTLQCRACRRTSHTFEPFLGLAVPIPAGEREREVSVSDCLRAFVEQEELEGENSYKCEACKRQQPHTKRLQVFRPPRVLVVTLKRFAQRASSPGFFSRFRSTAKNNSPVLIEPDRLDLTPYCNPLGLRGLTLGGSISSSGGGAAAAAGGHGGIPVRPLYQLAAVSHHSGSLEGGHYTAQARACLDGQWYNFNDSSVRREHGRPSGSSSSAYVLFYLLECAQHGS